MDAVSLMRDIDLLAASSGVTLNPEQRAAIRPSLEILKQEKGFNSVLLWGKVLGDAGEYVIAEGVGFPPEGKIERNKVAGSEPVVTEYFDSVKNIPRQFFRLGADNVSWVPLPAVTPEISQKIADFETDLRRVGNVFVPLSGNASNKFAYKVIIPPPPKKVKEPVVVAEGEEPPAPEPEEEEKGPEVIEKELVEDERLAHLIAQINFATAVVPRGAYILNSSRQVTKNPYFSGIEHADALHLKNYMHLRRPAARQYQSEAERASLDKHKDFLDSLDLDAPKGCWSVVVDDSSNVVTLRSLLYPGFFFYHVLGSSSYGRLYVGNAERNYDLAFMLS